MSFSAACKAVRFVDRGFVSAGKLYTGEEKQHLGG
jgi:hypothetical protein